ncbi:MAG: aldehyde dehydrogenase [Anaerovoracaceae bacterium]|nr:aldehyde dehydrogenase [Anaerovoracaceae bacterium]
MDTDALMRRQNEYFRSGMTRPYAFRKEMLERLSGAMDKWERPLLQALERDLGKHRNEAYMCEVGIVRDELKYCRRRLRAWMRDKYVLPSVAQMPAACSVGAEPYGTVLIVSPWNYPVLLTLEPLIGALAAGNTAVIKPSSYSPHCSEVLADMMADTFPDKYVAVVQGGRGENRTLFEMDFDYIFFTGSVGVGKDVMRAAAENLTPVTLELGGKSPVIVDETADIALAAKRTAFGKIVNAGQTCVAPDYLLIQENVRDRFIHEFRDVIGRFFPGGDYLDMAHIINEKHFNRICGLMEGQNAAVGGGADADALFIEPTILTDVDPESPVMREEIFGPVLPVITYRELGEAIDFVRGRPKPLALYLFTKDRMTRETVLDRCSFGGGCVNDVLLHLCSSGMPFGGVGNSGMGAYHGRASFDTFSHKRSIMRSSTCIDVPLRYMPYSDTVFRILKFIFD